MSKIAATSALLCLLFSGCAALVPMTTVLNGDVPSGSIIVLQGYVSLEFEGQSIHESQQDCEAGDTARALWVDIQRKNIPDGWQHCSFAEVSGVYRPDDTGHFGGWPSGAIVSVNSIRTLRR